MTAVWYLIRRDGKITSIIEPHYTPACYAQQPFDVWAEQSTSAKLPVHVQDVLASCALVRRLRLASALLQSDDEDDVQITEEELHCALSRGFPWR